MTYPFVKRFLSVPQLYLGVAFGWGIPMAFAAQLEHMPRVAWLLLIANMLWVTVYDTIYAMVDRDDDLKIGVRSTAILFGDSDRHIIAVLQAMTLLSLYLAGRMLHMSGWYYAGLDRRSAFLRLSSLADPRARSRRLLSGLSQQQLLRHVGVHRDSAHLPVPPLNAAARHAHDARWVRRSFDRASATYDAAAVLQAEVRGSLLERLDLTRARAARRARRRRGYRPARRALKRRYPDARVLAVDSARGDAARRGRAGAPGFGPSRGSARTRRGCRSPDGSVDLVFSNFLLPWCDPDALFAEFRRVLAPRGFLTFTSLGPDTLKELRAAWAAVDCSQPRAAVHRHARSRRCAGARRLRRAGARCRALYPALHRRARARGRSQGRRARAMPPPAGSRD